MRPLALVLQLLLAVVLLGLAVRRWRDPAGGTGWRRKVLLTTGFGAGALQLVGAAVGLLGSPLALIAILALVVELAMGRDASARLRWVAAPLALGMALVTVVLRLPATIEGIFMLDPVPEAPLALVPARTLVTLNNYTPELLESIDINSTGSFVLSLLTRSQVLVVAKDGSQSVLATLPSGTFEMAKGKGFIGALLVDAQDNVLVNVNAQAPENHGIWKVAADGKSQSLLATVPPEVLLNGIAMDPQGNIYVADAANASVYWIPFGTQQAKVWKRDPLLEKKGFKLLPGANGLKVWNGAVYVSNTSRSTFVRIPILPDGLAGEASVFIENLGADDFAFDEKGALYVTTHPFNTILRVSPDRSKREVIATAAQGVTGPTSAVFGRTPETRSKLYVCSDGDFMYPPDRSIPNVVELDVSAAGAGEPSAGAELPSR